MGKYRYTRGSRLAERTNLITIMHDIVCIEIKADIKAEET